MKPKHTLIVGPTGSGKSRLMKALARQYLIEQKFPHVFALTDDAFPGFRVWPMDAHRWRAKRDYAKILFVDEARFLADGFDWILPEGRKYGISAYVACQDITQIDPAIRVNFTQFIFFQGVRVDLCARLVPWVPDLKCRIASLKLYEFLWCSPPDKAEKGKVN